MLDIFDVELTPISFIIFPRSYGTQTFMAVGRILSIKDEVISVRYLNKYHTFTIDGTVHKTTDLLHMSPENIPYELRRMIG